MIPKWHKRFLDLSEHISHWSLDPSTKVGAVITDNDNRVISVGYNGFPKGIKDDERLNDRDKKYEIVVHGEVNSILFAKESLKDKILFTFPFSPCSRCAGIVIQSGIKQVITYVPDSEKLKRWGDSFNLSKNIFKEAGVELIEYGKCENCVEFTTENPDGFLCAECRAKRYVENSIKNSI